VDGEIHSSDQAQSYDDGRTGELERLGISVIRFTNDEVLENTELVIKKFLLQIVSRTSPALPGSGGSEGVRHNLRGDQRG